MSIASQLTLLAQTKETQRKLLGLSTDVPFSQYHFYMQRHPDAEIKALFKDGKQGVWYDPSDLSTMFQDAAGTQPVTKDGDPVGLILDKSGNGNHATQSVSTSRPIYKTDGILHWLSFDGVDDFLNTLYVPAATWATCVSYKMLVGTSSFVFDSIDSNTYLYFSSGGTGVTISSSGINRYLSKTTNTIGVASAISAGTQDSTPTPSKAITLGARYSSGATSFCFNGNFYGFFITSNTLTLSDRELLANYLAKKAGVTL